MLLNIRILILCIVLLLQPGLVMALGAGDAPAFDASVVRLQNKAERLYRDGHWERAYFIYVNELAAAGDKHAQYMAGYMNLYGHGVEQDVVAASAWFRLAAERGVPEYVGVRDRVLAVLNEDDLARSDAEYLALRKQFSDLALIVRYLSDEWRERQAASRYLAQENQPGGSRVQDPWSGRWMERSEFISQVDSSMRGRIDYIASRIGLDGSDIDLTATGIEQLAARVDTYLEVIDDR